MYHFTTSIHTKTYPHNILKYDIVQQKNDLLPSRSFWVLCILRK
nr:MAG TPA: hypothetical protein [Caudoviricetes sp.]